MANSFLDKTGLTYLWGKIVALVNRKQDALTFDSTPTDNSTNPVTSGGVKAYVDANAGGGDSPFESGTGNGSAVLKNADNMALAVYSTAEGYGTHAFGVKSHTEGEDTYAIGYQAHAEGYRTVARGYAHSEGLGTTFKLNITGTVGSFGNVYACASIPDHLKAGMHILKPNTTILIPIIAVDRTNKQITCASSLDGTTGKVTVYCSSAYGDGSHAEGSGSAAFGIAAHAEGSNTGAKGANSHAEGRLTEANGGNSHAEGVGTIANSENQHVEGTYNVADTVGTGTYAHITGIGTSDSNRKNGFTVDWNGNGFFRGRLEVSNSGFSGWTDSTVVTKKYFNELSKTVVLLEDSNESYQVTLPSDGSIWSGHILVVQDLTYGSYPFVGHDYSTLRDYLYKYALEYTTVGASEGDADRHLIPLTKVEVLSEASGNMYAKIVFGNNEKTYLAGAEGYTCWIPESEWTPGINFEFPYQSGE